MRRVSFAICGPGAIARMHAEVIRALPEAELRIVYSHRKESARRFSEQFKVPWTVKYDDVLKSDVDVVDVCTPHNVRSELILPAIERKARTCRKTYRHNA